MIGNFLPFCSLQEVDLLLNDGSKNINVAEWRKTGMLASRVELSRRQSRRSLLMALALAATPDQKVNLGPSLYVYLALYLWLRDLYYVTKRLQLHINIFPYETYTIAGVLSIYIPERKAETVWSISQCLHI